MFTKSQLAAAAVVVASASSVIARPVYVRDVADLETRNYGLDALTELKRRAILEYLEDLEARGPKQQPPAPKYGQVNPATKDGWIEPERAKGRDGKVGQTSQVLAIQTHKDKNPTHPAVAPGNTAKVQTGFHENGGATHATVQYKKPDGSHASTLHLAKDGTQLIGNAQSPAHRGGASPPPTSPASSTNSRAGSPSSQKSGKSSKRDLELVELIARELGLYDDLEVRMPKQQPSAPKYGKVNPATNDGWIEPERAKGRDGKVSQTGQVLAVQAHKNKNPTHPAVAPGNTAKVQTGFHENGGATHATVQYKKPDGSHASTLHLAKDGTQLIGNTQPPAHRGGVSPPPTSPASSTNSRAGSPSSQKSGKSSKRDLELVEFFARGLGLYDDLEIRGPKQQPQAPKYGKVNPATKDGWIEPERAKGRDGKVGQTSQVLAIQTHKDKNPTHPAVASGNTAKVQTGFHENGGATHATVQYKKPDGSHASTLHLAKDGTQLIGNAQPAAHRGGASPPPTTPASSTNSRAGSPSSQKSGKSSKRDLDLVEFIARELGLYDDLD